MTDSRRIITFTILLEFFIVVAGIVFYGFTVEALHTITRFSGRLSLLIFSIIFLFLHREPRVAQWLSSNPYLVFAVAHGIHLIELLLYVYYSGTVVVPYRLAGGFIAYLMIFLMPIATYRHTAQQLTDKSFRRLEMFYQYYVWFIFFMTYLTRVQRLVPGAGGTYLEHVAGLGWVSMMLGTKLIGLLMPARR